MFRKMTDRIPVVLLVAAIMVGALLPALGSSSQVQETVLPNGLKVLTKEVHAAPVVNFEVWYKVGSRNEQIGKTGLSHIVEHMQFKGTRTLKKGDIDRLILKNGGMSNAETYIDFTYFWETLSSDKLALAMRIESDRMVNSVMDPNEFKSEMTVVRSELEGDENDPVNLEFYELYHDAYVDHPYTWPTIGWRHDVENMTRNDVYKHYKTYYMPNNATVVIVGDFDTSQALKMVKKYFGPLRRGTQPLKVTALEPAQSGERRAEIRKPGAAYRVMMGFHTPAIGDPDVYVLDVLDSIMSNGTSSRLYKALVDKQLATEAWTNSSTSHDPNLFLIGATAREGVDIKDVESALLAEVERVKSQPVSDEELQKALNQLEAQFIYMNDSVSDQAEMLGDFETIYSWKYLDTYLDNVRKVTPADIMRVAQKYLVQKNRTVVTFIPEGPKVEESPGGMPGMLSALPSIGMAAYRPIVTSSALSLGRELGAGPSPSPLPSPARGEGVAPRESGLEGGSAKSAVRTRVALDNGMVVIIQENRSNPTLAIQGSIKAGSMFDPDGKDGLAEMTASLLPKGTATRTADQIGAAQDYVGMNLTFGAEAESATFSGKCLSKNFDLLLDLLSDSLRNPTFPTEELEKQRSQRLSEIKQFQESPERMAQIGFYGTLFPKGHPYYQASVEDQLAAVPSITRDDIADFYKSHYGPQSAILVIVGDVDTQEAVAKIKHYFGDWERTGAPSQVVIPDTPLQTDIVKKVIPMVGKSQVNALLGWSGGLKRSDPDFYAANVMNFILGGGGSLGSRLGYSIRDTMGLAYTVYSMFDARLGAGPWMAQIGTNPANVDKALKILVEQINLMRDKGATQAELQQVVDFLTGSFPVRLETNSAVANALHAAEFYGLGMDYIQNYQKIYRSVTLDQVNAAARKYLHPDQYTLVIAGSYKAK